MLGKLIKYEFKHTAKTMFMTYGVLAVFTLMASVALYRMDRGLTSENTFAAVLSTTMLILYVIAIVAIYCVDFIYLIHHYHKTMYSAQGYLTHTLPVSPAASFGTKILVISLWMLVSTVLSVFSVLALLQGGSGGEFFHVFNDLAWRDFSRSSYEIFGISGGYFLSYSALISVLNILLCVLWIAASMAVGQLFRKNRTAYSILAAFAFKMISQIVSGAFMIISGYDLFSLLDGEAASFMKTVLNGPLVITLIFLVLLYGICIYINSRKLNLE